MKELWVEKYRPKNISEYVFRDEAQKAQVQSWIDSNAIPHLLFSGGPGTGKTTLAKVLLDELGVDDGDVMFINASSHTGVEQHSCAYSKLRNTNALLRRFSLRLT